MPIPFASHSYPIALDVISFVLGNGNGCNIQYKKVKVKFAYNKKLLYIWSITINDLIMEEKEYFEKMNIEFKKLNFALDSYRYCHMKAVARTSDEWKGDETKVSFLLEGGDGKGILVYQTTVGNAFEDLLSFKKKSLDLCTHAKKETI